MKIKEVLLGLIIAVVFLMFLVFGSKLIYENPNYEDYCNYSKIYEKNDTVLQNQLSQECTQKYDSANENYSKRMFVFSIIVGILIVIGSAVFIESLVVSGGLMFGSLMFLIYGTGSYWRYMNDWTRFVILGVALGTLIYVSYRIGDKNRNKKRK